MGLLSSSCAYYNTFYLARKYYTTATAGLPYPVEKPTGAQTGNYQKSIDYSKKVIANYPKSKWVDDAYLMWAQALLGKDDPLQSVNMLLDFPTRYPASARKTEATFYLGVAYRQARKHREALVSLDEYLVKAPNRELAPYAHLERARALMSLERPADAALAASEVVERFPQSPLMIRARAARAEALLASGDPTGARRDFQVLGLRALDDNERFLFLLREADCLEAAREYPVGIELLAAALSHEPAPVKSAPGLAPTGVGVERYGQLTLRIGTLHLLAGRAAEALAAYGRVLQDYPKTTLGAEAQYRIGYTHETVLDDFEIARQEYAKVRDQSMSSAFFAQATQRLQSLDRLTRFRGAGGDSSDRKLEAGFLLAEQYLFQLDKPERARDAYAEIAQEHAGTAAAAKAMNAEAWVLRRKLEQPAAADSLLWRVIREYPATEAQIAARDYLEAAGHRVPPELIKLAEPVIVPRDTTAKLRPSVPDPAPEPSSPAWPLTTVPVDSLAAGAAGHGTDRPSPFPGLAGGSGRPVPGTGTDTTRFVRPGLFTVPGGDGAVVRPSDPRRFPSRPAPADSVRRVVAGGADRMPADTVRRAAPDVAARAAADTSRRAPTDTSRAAPADTTRRPPARWVPTDTLRWSPR